MSESARFIEVIAQSATDRCVDSYQAEVQVVVNSRKPGRESCFEESLKLRDEVISVLKQSGIPEENILEGNGDRDWYYDENWRRIAHSLQISHKDITKLIKAMGKVEQMFSAKKRSFFSPLKRSFTMKAPQACYSSQNQTIEEVLHSIVMEARKKADSLASAAGLQISGVLTVIEDSDSGSNKSGNSLTADDDDLMDLELSENYTVLSPQRKLARRQFRVRFAVE